MSRKPHIKAAILFVAVVVFVGTLWCLCKKRKTAHRERFIGPLPEKKDIKFRNTFLRKVDDEYRRLFMRALDPVSAYFYKHLLVDHRHEEEDPTNIPEKVKQDMDRFHSHVEVGSDKCQQRTAVFCGLLRDNEDQVSNIISTLGPLVRKFKDYRVLILENNSADATRKRLLEWVEEDPNVIILCHSPDHWNEKVCVLTSSLFEWSRFDDQQTNYDQLPTRIHKMSILREVLYQCVLKHFSSFDYMLMMDFDLEARLFPDGVMDSIYELEINPNYDVLTANGMMLLHSKNSTDVTNEVPFYYYDSFAYVEDEVYPMVEYTHSLMKRYHDEYVHTVITKKYSESMTIDPVVSAFGGMAIYRISSLIEKSPSYHTTTEHDYQAMEIPVTTCEHTVFHQKLGVAVNPRMILLISKNP